MAFWSTEKVKDVLGRDKIIDSYTPDAVKCGAYELALGSEAFVTSDEDSQKQIVDDGKIVSVPPGQFGLLITEETIKMPQNAIGFISIKAGIKFRGLVNVSGFHVDPGFTGKLKFAVYNAGSQPIVLQRKDRVFLIWFSDLDRETQPYDGVHRNQNGISAEDIMKIQGDIASPAQLRKELTEFENKAQKEFAELENKVKFMQWTMGLLISIAVFMGIRSAIISAGNRASDDSDSQNKANAPFVETNRTNASPGIGK